MAMNAKKIPKGNSGNRVEQPLLEVGGYPGRVVQIIDFGLQKQRPFKGTEKPPQHEIYIGYEFSDEFMIDEKGEDVLDKPRWMGERIPLHNLEKDKAKSTQRYMAIDPNIEKEGDFAELISMGVVINVVKEAGRGENAGKEYNSIGSLSAMREKDLKKLPELINPPKLFDLDEPDIEVFGSLPEWMQKVIKENLNYNGSVLQKALGEKSKVSDEKPEAETEDEDEEENQDDEAPAGDDDDWGDDE